MLELFCRTFRRLGPLGALALVACSGPEAPVSPTWKDVAPILQGQCLHCHGASADKDGAGWRFDFLDASALCNLEPPSSSSFIAAKDLILTDINQSASGDRPKMPPEPGRLLEDWQKTTLERFVASVNALPAGPERAAMIRGPMPADARAPKIAVQYSRLNDVLLIDYSVTDENADPVIGELWVGDKLSASIAASGRGQAAFNLSGQPRGSSLQVTARLCDGWGLKTRGAADGLPSISN